MRPSPRRTDDGSDIAIYRINHVRLYVVRSPVGSVGKSGQSIYGHPLGCTKGAGRVCSHGFVVTHKNCWMSLCAGVHEEAKLCHIGSCGGMRTVWRQGHRTPPGVANCSGIDG